MAPAIVNTTVQATLLAILSNVLAQWLESYQRAKPLQLNTTPLINFIIFTVISTPPNVLWQEFLESQFPGYPKSPRGKSATKEKINIGNTIIKVLLDQILGALVNTVLFIGMMAALKGMNNKDIIYAIKTETWPLMVAGFKVWPLVSVISFTLLPVEQRVVFISIVGVGWGIFLSMVASK